LTLDDLFSAPEPPEQPRQAAAPQLRWVTLLLSAGALAGLAFAALRLNEITAPVLVLFVAALTLVGALRLVRRLRPPPPSRHAGRHHEDRTYLPDGLKAAINRWDTILDWCQSDVSRYNHRVLPKLAELADERLRRRHGVTRTSDPHTARSILGDALWEHITTAQRRPPGPRELDQIVSALEKL
jgi:hypothetical protein